MKLQYLTLFLFFITFNQINIKAHDDSTLYVRVEYQHKIVKGRNSSIRVATRQEMRNSDNEFFREVFYDFDTKKLKYILYYFYNSDNSLRLIEKVNSNEKLEEYFKYAYKKKKLSSIEHYYYSIENNKSKLVSVKKYKNKKNYSICQKTDANQKLITTTNTKYENGFVVFKEITNHTSDSILKSTEKSIIVDSKIQTKQTTQILVKKDTVTYLDEYIYGKNDKIERIDTYKLPDKEDLIYHTLFKYYKGGSLENKRKIGKNNYYLENKSYRLNKYYRELPTRTPLF